MVAPSPVRAPDASDDDRRDLPWIVVVWDDPVNLMDYVVFVFQEVFGFALDTATELMLRVHHEGSAVVFAGGREPAELAVQRLHGYGLWATLDRES